MAIQIATICGSVRPGNYTSKALRLALDEFAKRSDVEVTPKATRADPLYPRTITVPTTKCAPQADHLQSSEF